MEVEGVSVASEEARFGPRSEPFNKTQRTTVTKQLFGQRESDHVHSLLLPARYRNRTSQEIFGCK